MLSVNDIDGIGALNVMIPFTVVVAATTIVWPLMKSQSTLIAIAVTYGCVDHALAFVTSSQ